MDICNGGDGKHKDSDKSDGEKDGSAKGDTGKGEWDKSNFDKDGVKNVKKGIVTAAESFQACFVDNPPLLLRIYGNIAAILIVLPAVLWAALTVVRLIQIRYPLKHIGVKKFLTTVAGFVVTQIILTVVILNSARPGSTTVHSVVVWIGSTQQIMVFSPFGYPDWPKVTVSVILYAVPILYQFVGLVACVLTIVTLMSNKNVDTGTQSKRNYTKITVKILLGNTCSFIYLVYVCGVAFPSVTSYYTQLTSTYSYSAINLVASSVVPCFLAALNPIIFILLTPNSLGKLRIWKKTSSKRATGVTNVIASE